MTQAKSSTPVKRQTAFGLDHGLPLIGTKLVPPRSAGTVLARTRLLEKINLVEGVSPWLSPLKPELWHQALNVLIHPKYKKRQPEYDLALIYLNIKFFLWKS